MCLLSGEKLNPIYITSIHGILSYTLRSSYIVESNSKYTQVCIFLDSLCKTKRQALFKVLISL